MANGTPEDVQHYQPSEKHKPDPRRDRTAHPSERPSAESLQVTSAGEGVEEGGAQAPPEWA